jgi:hypothetical protein
VRQEVPWGVLYYIQFEELPDRPAWTTHLIFGNCTEPQAREYLVSIGLGAVGIHTVYGANSVVEEALEEVDDL